MPDVEPSKNGVFMLSVCCLSHVDQFLWEIRDTHPRLQRLHLVEFDQDAVQSVDVPLDLLFKCSLRLSPSNHVDVRSLSLAKSSEVLFPRVRLQAREAGPDFAPNRETRSVSLRLEFLPKGRLTSDEKCLWVFSLATQLEGSEVFVPKTLRHLRPRFHPESELIEVLKADLAVTHALD